MTNTLAVAQQGEAILTLIASSVTQAEFSPVIGCGNLTAP